MRPATPPAPGAETAPPATYQYRYPHPAVTVDCVLFGWQGAELQVLLIQRKHPPFQDAWAFPGGFVEIAEDLEPAAHRELQEETGVAGIALEQFQAFGAPDRDPRERVITVAYWGIVQIADHPLHARDDARAVACFPVAQPPPLAFDHARILELALVRLREKHFPFPARGLHSPSDAPKHV